jgi:hypothetical protein
MLCQYVTMYHAIIWPKPDLPIDGHQVALLKMDLHFAIGFHAGTKPETVIEQMLISLRIHEMMDVISIKEVEIGIDSLYLDPG